MRICFLADGRSPIAQNWIRYFIARGREVHLISSYPCPPDTLPVASLTVVPVAFSHLAGKSKNRAASPESVSAPQTVKAAAPGLKSRLKMQAAARLRDWIGPLDVWRHAGRVRDLVQQIQPNLVHAMRIPYEGLLAAEALRGVRVPLLLSIWGNDFTLHAAHSPVLAWMTRRALRRADALHPDTKRDLRLARELGFSCEKPGAVLPSAGGIQRDLFTDGPASPELAAAYAIPLNQEGRPAIPVVINSRGARSYVRNDTFFQAIPRVLAEKPETRFLCVAMQGNAMAQEWIEKLNISAAVRLLPSLSRQEMAEHFRLATVTVSPSEHDGTPNTLLEAMACGAFPVAGDIESVREWITHEQNGLLCDPGDPVALGYCIVQALEDEKLRCRAAAQNQQLIADHADYTQVMREAERFYEKLAQRAILPVETL